MTKEIIDHPEVHPGLQAYLTGRIWHRTHLPFEDAEVDGQIAAGYIDRIPGVVGRKKLWNRLAYQCNRCETKDPAHFTEFHCEACEGPCAYCRHCLKMGRVATCTELVTWVGPPLAFKKDHAYAWQGRLTDLQRQAADALMASNEAARHHLIFAVCGAGKTEILFDPIYQLLQAGKRICVAAPRVDVILELFPRFQQAFPTTDLVALYGGSDMMHEKSQLVLATTHQLYRFSNAFDAIFVDEADAFPYTADATLRRAVEKAAKKEAPIHFVTATPTAKQQQEASVTGGISIIPRRFHGHPLPLPSYQSLWRYAAHIQKGSLPKKLQDWIKKCLQEGQPYLLFFHHIELMEAALPLIQAIHPEVEAVHAAHPDRKELVQALRNQELKGLLTTTILERGITIPNVQVAVVGAEQSIFTKSALIQIGGRVGRSKDFPTGDFILFHHGITFAMDDANREIKQLNRKGGFT